MSQVRKWIITDEAGKEIKLTVGAPPPSLIVVDKWEIDMELKTKRDLNDLISTVNNFMGGNTINKVEIEEEVV